MKKHLQLLSLFMVLCVPWMSQAQTLDEYSFTTGVDATKWVMVPTSITSLISAGAGDYGVSTVQNLGFTFPFGEGTYTQFSVNSDGNLRLGGTVTGTSNYSSPFSSSNASVNNPKINFFGCDGYCDASHYVRYMHTANAAGDSMGVVEFCMGTYTSTTRSYLYKWQVHLYHNGTVEVVFGVAPSTAPAVARQQGICVSAADGWTIDASHVATHFTSGASATIASGTWPSEGRYYRFDLPNYSCPKPTSVTVANLDASSFDINWTDTSNATSWQVSVTSGSASIYNNVVTTMPVSITGLTSNTSYTVGVAGFCQSGDTSAYRQISVRTPCVVIDSLPYTYGFEDCATTTSTSATFADCWTHLNNGSTYFGYPYISSTAAYNHTPGGARGLYWYASITAGTYGDYQCIVLPPVDTTMYPINTLQLKFWARATSTSYNPSFQVGIMSNPDDISTFQLVDVVNVGNNTTYTEFEVPFGSFTGVGNFVAVKAVRPTSSWYANTDDFTLCELPPCPHPVGLHASYISQDSITLAWLPGANESAWIVSDGTNEYEVYDTTYTFDQLSPSTLYTYSVRALCSGIDTSTAITGSFRTPCSYIPLPYTEDFETYGTGTTAFPACWTKIGSTADRPYIHATTTYGHNNTHGLYFFASSGGYCYAVMPPTNHSLDSLQVSLWARQYSASYDCQFAVGVMTDPNDITTFVPIDTVYPATTIYEQFDVPLSSYTGTGRYVAFSAILASGSSIYMMLDDVTLDYLPLCPHVDNLRTTYVGVDTVILAWNSGGNESSWLVSDGTNEYEVTDSTYTFDQLVPNTSYTFTIRSLCPSGDTSWAATITVRTACSYVVLPHTEDFETYGTGTTVFPSCWTKIGSTANRPYIHATTTYGHNNTHGLYFYAASGGYCYAVMPPTNHSIDSLQVSLWTRQYSTSYDCALVVGVMTDPNNISTFVPVDTVHPATTNYEQFDVPLSSYTGTGNYVAFSAIVSSGTYTYIMLDDVTLDYLPQCPHPNDLRCLAYERGDSTVITWNELGGATGWQIFIDTVGTVPGDNSDLLDVYDTVYTFTDLVNGGSYDIYVRSDCGSGEYSPWAGPLHVSPGSITIGTSGSASITACNVTVYDDGGPLGEYSNSVNYTLTINSPSPDSVLAFSGWAYTEGSIDYLRIYDGPTINGTLLWQTGTSSARDVIPMTLSTTGSITMLFYSDGSVIYDGFEVNVHCEAAPTCNMVTSPVVSNAAGTSALLNWNISRVPNNVSPAYAEIEVYQGTMLVNSDTASSTPYWITGLTPGTNYYVRVRGVCPNDEPTPWDSVSFHTVCLAGGDLELLAGTTSNSFYPTNIGSAYSYTQELYESSRLGGAMTITGVSYYVNGTLPTRNICLYLGETTQSSFSSYSDYVRDSLMHLVYTGNISASGAGWVTIYFDSAFTYSGAGNICVGFDDNTGSTGSVTWRTGSGTHQAIHYHNSVNINPAAPVGTTQLNTTVQNDIRFHSACDTTATCVAPNVIITSVTSDEATISWAPGLNETSWELAHRSATESSWTVDATGWSTTTYTFTGLNTNETYYFRVTPDCGNDSIFATVSGTTACMAQPLPFTENFDTWATGYVFPNCWYKGTNYSTNYPSVSTSYAASGTKALYMYSSNSSYSYIALPLMAASIDSLQVSFMLYKTNTSYAHSLQVGVMADPSDITTFTSLATVGCSALSTWEPFEIPLSNYTGDGGYIAIVSPNSVYCYPYLDNLEVAYIATCPRPTNVYVTDATMNTALVHWSDTSADNFEIEVGPTGFTHGTGTTFYATNVDTVTVTGLSANQGYDVYVRGICGIDDTSNWSFCTSFRSACGLIDSLPWHDDLEFYSTGSSSSSVFIPCWNRINNGTSYFGYPYLSSSTSYSHNGGSKGFYWYNTTTTGTYGDYQYVVLPGIDTTVYPMNTVQLRFYAKPSSSSYIPTFIIGVMAKQDSISTFTPVDTVTLTSTDWTEIEVPFTNFTGRGCYPCVMATRPSSSWYAYVDDFYLEIAPTCSRPTHLTSTGNTSTTVTLDWTERNSATEWELAVETSATAAPTADSIVTSHPLTVTGLTAGVHYYFYVRSICGTGDTSLWSDALTCVPGSWNMRPNMTDTLHMCGGTIYDDGGPTGVYAMSQNSTVIIVPDRSNSLVSVSGSSYTEGSFDYITIYDGVGTSGTQLWTDNGISTLTNFGPFLSTTGAITVTFHTDGSVAYDGFEINVSCVTTSCRVGNIRRNTATAAADDHLDIIWDTNGALYYQVEYGNTGFAQGTGTLLTTYNNYITINGLTGLTSYDVYVRSICPGGDTGSWVLATFQTAMCATSTEVYSYSSTASTTTSTYAPIGYSFYDYGFVQTLIDSAEFAGLTDPINAFAFYPTVTTSGTYYQHCDVYMANVPESDLSSGFILPNTTTHQFVQVIHDGDLCYTTTGWQLHGFDTTFTWDGHSNILVTVNRGHGDYESGATFAAHTTSGVKTRYLYQDGTPYNVNNPTGGSSGTGNYVGDLKFIACAPAGCRVPVITGVAHTYESVTATWTGTGTNYQVNIKEAAATDFTAPDIDVTGTTYTFTGLNPSTNYTIRVRQDCTADSLGYSNWSFDAAVTDSMPCFSPDSLNVIATTNATATFDWNVIGIESAWELHVWFAGYDSSYVVTTRPATVGGFSAGLTYNAAIRPLCGSAHQIEGDWSDTIQFTTAICPDVTGLSSSNVTANSVTLSWSANSMAQSWIIEYGYQGFSQGTGTIVTSTTNNYVFNGLLDETSYDFNVRAVCGTDWMSEHWTSITVTTLSGGVTCDAPTNVNAAVAGNAATITWTNGEGNISFEIEYGPTGFSHGAGTVATATGSPVTINNLDYETEYDLYVRAVCAENTYSAWSNRVTFTTDEEPSQDCDPVQNLAVSDITETSATVTWTPGQTGDEWEVVLTDAAGATLNQTSTQDHQHQYSGLTSGTTYIVKVRTVCGDEQYSSYQSASFTTVAVGVDNVSGPRCTIYPNPATSSATISVSGVTGQVRIAVVDMNGRTVASETLECAADCVKTMDVESLAQGAYFVRVTGDTVNMVKKLIVR